MNIVIALIISAYAQPPIQIYTCEKTEDPKRYGEICLYEKLKCKIYGIELFKYTACAVKNGSCPDVQECIDNEGVIEISLAQEGESESRNSTDGSMAK